MTKAHPEAPPSHILYYQMLADYFTRILKAREENRFLAAHTIFFPVEILYAMDIVPMHTELTAWMTALFGGNVDDLLAKSGELGMAPEICSPYRVLGGALATKALPRPDVALWTNLICDNAGKSGDLVMQMSGCDGFFLDCPFKKSNRERHYLYTELQDMIAFLEKQSGRRMDWNKLSEGVTQIGRQIELYRAINDLRRNQPSPLPPEDFLKLFTVDCLMAGRPEVTQYLEQVLSESKEKIHAGSSREERFRIMNLMMPPVLLLGSLTKVSAEYGAVSVTDPLFCEWADDEMDPQRPLESVIRKIEMHPVMSMYGPLDESLLLQKVVECASRYQVDGAIHYAHIGCRQSASLIKPFKEALDAQGIPVLILDSDIIDITVAPKEELERKLRQFFELLEDR